MPHIDHHYRDRCADRQHARGSLWRAVQRSGDEGGAGGGEQGRGDVSLELVWLGSGHTLERAGMQQAPSPTQ